MKSLLSFSLLLIAILALLPSMPRVVMAKNASMFLVTCGDANPHAKPLDPQNPSGEKECGFLDVIAEIKLLVTTFFMLSVPLTVIVVAYSGVQILLAQGNTKKITEARVRLQNIVIGFIILLGAWLLVYTITSQLLKPEFYTPFLGGTK